uniref:C2H2-type domain-containing protein n=1 Tax=Stomoxys calcitrans TaxID=35570 RepID=A0A1I8NTH1_STOCA
MGDYSNYIRIGEILRSPPATDTKSQYILKLKCAHCVEHVFMLLESFVFPCHECEINTDINQDHILVEEIKIDDGNYEIDEGEDVTTAINVVQYYNNKDIEKGDPLNVIKSHLSDDEAEMAEDDSNLWEEEFGEQSKPNSETANEIHVNESIYVDATNLDENERDGELTEDMESNQFIQNFLKSNKNRLSFVEAFKNQSGPGQKKLQQNVLTKIRKELKSKNNLQLTNKQIARIAAYMRNKFPEEMNNCETTLVRCEQTLETKTSEKLNSHQIDLKSKQLIQLLVIYERFPFLWNSDLIEICCKNKRQEALDQMLISVNKEINVNIDIESLKNYLLYIHNRFAKEKRSWFRNEESKIPQHGLAKHMMFLKSHVGPFRCPVCSVELKNPLNFKVHKSRHDGTMPLKCSLCGKDFKVLATYILHARRHMDDMVEECKECGKKFINPYELKIHMRFHTGAKPFCCEICGVSFRHIQTFATHKRSHEKKYLHTCATCSKGFYSKAKLDDHVRSHKQIREFVCKTCGKAFIMKKTLQQHQVIHEDVRRHACSLCGKAFKLKVGLSQHMKTHGRNSSKECSEEIKVSVGK